MKDQKKKFKPFQIRWREEFGMPNDPYVRRWSLLAFGWSFRLHQWIRSDDNRYFHDHGCDLTSYVLKGWYWNNIPSSDDNLNTKEGTKILCKAPSIWKAKAEGKHYIQIPEGQRPWTLVVFKPPHRKWGFWVNNDPKNPDTFVFWRPNRYYSKFGIVQTSDYTGEHNEDPTIT